MHLLTASRAVVERAWKPPAPRVLPGLNASCTSAPHFSRRRTQLADRHLPPIMAAHWLPFACFSVLVALCAMAGAVSSDSVTAAAIRRDIYILTANKIIATRAAS